MTGEDYELTANLTVWKPSKGNRKNPDEHLMLGDRITVPIKHGEHASFNFHGQHYECFWDEIKDKYKQIEGR